MNRPPTEGSVGDPGAGAGVRALVDELAVQRLLAEYCRLCDDGEFQALAARFVPDGVLAFAGREHVGREAVVRFFESTPPPFDRGRHLTTNVVVDLDGDTAVASADFLFLAVVDGALTPLMAGRYRDELVRRDGRWSFRRREATPLGPPPA